MIPGLRRLVAACLLLLHPALIAAPAEAVCVHAAAEGDAVGDPAAASHTPGGPHAHAHGSADHTAGSGLAQGPGESRHEHGSSDSSCPMDGGLAGCAAQVPLPQSGGASLVSTEILDAAGLTSSTEPPATDPAPIFHPPRS